MLLCSNMCFRFVKPKWQGLKQTALHNDHHMYIIKVYYISIITLNQKWDSLEFQNKDSEQQKHIKKLFDIPIMFFFF